MKTTAILSAIALIAGAAQAQGATVSHSSALTVYAPTLVQAADGAHIKGAVCRTGPVSHISISNLMVVGVGADGAATSEQGGSFSTVLRERGARCGFYNLKTPQTFVPGATFKVCMDADGRKVCSAS